MLFIFLGSPENIKWHGSKTDFTRPSKSSFRKSTLCCNEEFKILIHVFKVGRKIDYLIIMKNLELTNATDSRNMKHLLALEVIASSACFLNAAQRDQNNPGFYGSLTFTHIMGYEK